MCSLVLGVSGLGFRVEGLGFRVSGRAWRTGMYPKHSGIQYLGTWGLGNSWLFAGFG